MNLSTRLFQVIDDEPVYSPVLINIKCFKTLYMSDTSEDKSKYAQHLLYIWYVCDPNSPYFNAENRLDDASMEVYGRKKKITKVMRKCMEEYTIRQSTPMIRAYERAMKAADQNSNILVGNQELIEEWQRLIKDANFTLKQFGKDPQDIVDRLELTDRITDLELKIIKKSKEMSALIPAINKGVESLLELKKKVDKDRLQLDSDDNKESISNYVIDEFIDKYG